ncbi:MAG: dihydroorotate dehydrogenase electron transfer subunit [Candidatus Bathyarchaeota archaeon]|nr:dihydroorotate dehydrogenase electron transfer subunit [Candidatus Bathyarchaeota archaeon]
MHTGSETMKVVRIERVVQETPDVTTLYFPSVGVARPGQYLMVWLPGIDEIPMSLSTIGDPSSVSVRVVGDATRALSKLKKGDKIGVRGPFGNGYTVKGNQPLLVGGGSGIASLVPLAEELVAKGAKPTFLIGARSKDQLLFKERLTKLGVRLVVSTDDGSEGFHGYSSNYAEELMAKGDYDQVYICGPELMASKIWVEADRLGLPVEASLERLCKCAVGLCGSCAIGPYRVCKDGPIFDSVKLREVAADFGKRRMDASGRMIRVDH